MFLLRKILLSLVALVALCACDQRAFIAEHTPPDALAFAHAFFDKVREGDIGALMTLTADMKAQGISDAQRQASLREMIAKFPQATPDSFEVLGFNTTIYGAVMKTHLVIEYRVGKPSVIANISLVKKSDGSFTIEQAYFNVIPVSFADFNAFRLEGKPLSSVLVLAGNILGLIFLAVTFLFVLRRADLRWRWKWLWLVLSVTVLFKAEVNWTTNQIVYQLFYIGIFPLGIDREGYSAPWTFATWFPIGAILVWLIRPGSSRRAPKVDLATFD